MCVVRRFGRILAVADTGAKAGQLLVEAAAVVGVRAAGVGGVSSLHEVGPAPAAAAAAAAAATYRQQQEEPGVRGKQWPSVHPACRGGVRVNHCNDLSASKYDSSVKEIDAPTISKV